MWTACNHLNQKVYQETISSSRLLNILYFYWTFLQTTFYFVLIKYLINTKWKARLIKLVHKRHKLIGHIFLVFWMYGLSTSSFVFTINQWRRKRKNIFYRLFIFQCRSNRQTFESLFFLAFLAHSSQMLNFFDGSIYEIFYRPI